MLQRGTWKDCNEARHEVGSNDAVNNITAIFLMIHISDTIQDDFIRGTAYNFADASHQLRHEWPCESRYQGTEEATVPASQTGSGDAGHKALLFHDAQYTLSRCRVYIWFLIQYTRDGCLRNTRQACNVQDRQLLNHSQPSLWVFFLKKVPKNMV